LPCRPSPAKTGLSFFLTEMKVPSSLDFGAATLSTMKVFRTTNYDLPRRKGLMNTHQLDPPSSASSSRVPLPSPVMAVCSLSLQPMLRMCFHPLSFFVVHLAEMLLAFSSGCDSCHPASTKCGKTFCPSSRDDQVSSCPFSEISPNPPNCPLTLGCATLLYVINLHVSCFSGFS